MLLAFLVCMFSLAAGHLAKFAQSVLIAHPEGGLLRHWYFVPAYLMKALAVPTLCYVALYLIRRFLGPGPGSGARRAYRDPRAWIFLAGMFFLFVITDFGRPYRYVDSTNLVVGEKGGHSLDVQSYLGTMIMNRLLPEGSIVGSWNAGIIGYFSRFPVVNLDGLISSYGYLRAIEEGAAESTFLRRFGLTHMADTSPGFSRRGPSLFESVPLDMYWWKYEEALRFRILQVGPPGDGGDRSEWFWERMEPHLERQAGGGGIFMDGRAAQAFTKDCTPDELAIWTWGPPTKGIMVSTPWTKTSIGFCTSAVVLPHDGLLPSLWTVDEYLADRVGERLPAIRSGFDVHLVENRLIYVKESCGQDDIETRFFLHIYPVVPDDLPDHRRRYGLDNRDFNLDEHGYRHMERGGPDTRVGETCLAEIPLPEYGIAAVRTGQYVAVEDGTHSIWEGEIRFR